MSEPSLYQPLGNHLAVARNGTTQSQVQFSTDYPVTRIETIADGTINFGKVGYLAAPADGYELQPGDILYSHINSIKHVGKVAQHFGEDKTLYHGMNLLLLRLDGEVDNRYFFHYLNSYNARHYAQKECQKSINQVSLNTGQIKKLSVFTPPLPEQRLVAHILDTLDTQIQKTEALIAKLEKVKEGLLHDLLTRGIDENGKLRPSPEQAPELYKESPLGLIPREWKCGSLGELSISSVIGPFGSDLVASDYRAEGVPVVFVRDVVSKTFTWKSEVYVDHQKAASLSAHDVIAGDVLLTKMGLPPCIACTYPSEFPEGIVTADIIRLRPDKSMVLPDWVSNYANSGHVASQVRAITSGVTRPKVTLNDVRSLKVAVPPLKDQRAILLRVSEAIRRVNAARTSLSKLLSEKSGLMDDLLTGRVRVTPLLEKEQAQATTPP